MKNAGGHPSRRSKKRHKWLVFFVVLAILLLSIGLLVVSQLHTRFEFGTVINGVNCSFLTVSEAQEKLDEELLTSQVILFTVLTKSESGYTQENYVTSGGDIELQLATDLQSLFDEQKESHEKTFNLQYSMNQELLRDFLLTIDELQEENQILPINAYLQMDGDKLEIVSEVYGLEIDFEEAYDMAISQITEGAFTIDFTDIFETEPDILSTAVTLTQNQKEINQILDTSITFVFSDGTEEVLDSSIISSWIVQDADGFFYLDEANITSYVDTLAETVSEKNSSVSFNATGIGTITLSVKQALRPQLDTETEISLIKEAIYTGETQTLNLVYDKDFVTDSNSYVELDITRQMVWLYIDGSCIMETDVVTGSVADGYSTPTGIYNLTYKTRAATLRGYNSDGSLAYASYVEYWMPFNGGIGFHDASWRSTFGGSIYLTNGSHGCVNMPFSAAQTLYQYINTEMSIFVYAS